MEQKNARRRALLYTAIIYGILVSGWLITAILPGAGKQTAYTLLWGLFSVFPLLSTAITRKLTGDRSSWNLRPNLRSSWKTYLFAAFLPGTVIFLGALLFYVLFPGDLDLTAANLGEAYGQYGAPAALDLTTASILITGLVFIVLSPLVFPVHLFALGEEIGWRGYLLPQLLELMDERKAVLLHGVLWGLAHAPLIAFGFNYAEGNWGAPWSGILMMVLVCTVLGVWLGYVTIRSGSILPACIFHGAGNVIGELPLLVSLGTVSPLLGPNPTGLFGMMGLLIGAVLLLTLFWKKSPGMMP